MLSGRVVFPCYSSVNRLLQDSVYLIIPVYNRKTTTIQCISRLQELEALKHFSVVVIDDGSTDGTIEYLRKSYPSITLLQGDGTLWWTGAIRLGMQYAIDNGGNFIIWLNDDCLIEKGSIENLVDFIRHHPGSIVGGIGYESSASTEVAFGGKRRKRFGYEVIKPAQQEIYPCDLLSGNFVCLPAKVIEDIGYPDDKRYPHYGGDSHFIIRARKAGYSIFLDARQAAQNIKTASTSKMNSNRWLLGDTSIGELFKLIFTPQSVLSWRVWWFLYTEDYGLLGIILFLIKITKTIAILLCISVLRLFPPSTRESISLAKRRLLSKEG